MAMVALIMRPWIILMRTFGGIKCYILADDVLIVATGIKMVPNFAKALNATHKFLHVMGSKVAPNKSYNFSSNKTAREWLKQTRWGNIDAEIEVVADLRYLGAHLTTKSSTSSGTLDKRWEKAAQQLRRLRYCPAECEAKVRVILNKVYAAAFYGVEAAQATPQKIAKLSAAVIDAFKQEMMTITLTHHDV